MPSSGRRRKSTGARTPPRLPRCSPRRAITPAMSAWGSRRSRRTISRRSGWGGTALLRRCAAERRKCRKLRLRLKSRRHAFRVASHQSRARRGRRRGVYRRAACTPAPSGSDEAEGDLKLLPRFGGVNLIFKLTLTEENDCANIIMAGSWAFNKKPFSDLRLPSTAARKVPSFSSDRPQQGRDDPHCPAGDLLGGSGEEKVFLPTYMPPEKMVKTLFAPCECKRWETF